MTNAMAFIGRCASFLKRQQLQRFRKVTIDPSARVNYRGIHIYPETELEIGAGSVVEGTIVAERKDVTIKIGRNTFVGGSQLVAAERIEIGDNVLIAWGCTIIDHNSHSTRAEQRRQDLAAYRAGAPKNWDGVVRRPVRIMDDAWIGLRSVILKGVTVGRGAIVGAGSVVTRSVPDGVAVAGNPANNILAKRTEDANP